MNKSLKIGLTCCMGGLIGTFVGLQFNSLWGLILSILIGATTGYLLWEFPKVIASMSVAYHQLLAEVSKLTRESIISMVIKIVAIICLSLSFTVCSMVLTTSLIVADLNVSPEVAYSSVTVDQASFPIGLGIGITMCGYITILLKCTALDYENFSLKKAKWVIFRLNPISLPFTGVYYFFKLIISVIVVIPYVMKFLWKVTKLFFFLIHSQTRLICAIDSGIGASIGWLYDSPVLGAVIGAIFGVLNYWIVSLKILKLKPKV